MLNVQGFRRIFIGEPVPDKDDPRYKERYEREVAAGKRFAEAIGLDKLGAKFYYITFLHKKAFFAIVLSIMCFFVFLNIYRVYSLVENTKEKSSAVATQESFFKSKVLENNKKYANEKD